MTQGSKPLIFVSKRLTDRSPRILLQRNALMNINGSFWPKAAAHGRPLAYVPFVHLTVQHLTGRRIKTCLVAQINGITVSSDIIIIEFTAFDEHETMASVKTI